MTAILTVPESEPKSALLKDQTAGHWLVADSAKLLEQLKAVKLVTSSAQVKVVPLEEAPEPQKVLGTDS